jgi:hypothetical protein
MASKIFSDRIEKQNIPQMNEQLNLQGITQTWLLGERKGANGHVF